MIRRRFARSWLLAMVLGGSLPAPGVQAQESPADSVLLSIEVHGFASQGFMITTANDYLVADTERGSFQMSEAGINFTRDLTDKLRFGIQLFAQNFSAAGNYNLIADWFYLDYRWRDWLGFRAGRLKIPFGLFNEINDIDAARVPLLLPQSVYPQQARNFLFAHTGTELYGFARSPWAGALEYRLFLGTIFIDPALVNSPSTAIRLTTNVPFVMGGRLLWETPLTGLRLAGSLQKVRLDATAYLGMATATVENNSLLWVLSADYTFQALTLTGEYSRWHTRQETHLPMPPDSVLDFTNERAYLMACLGITRWLQAGVYYSLFFPDSAQREGAANKQHDLAGTLRFDINAHWLIKLEGHYMVGAAGLSNPLMVSPPAAEVDDHWGVFLIQTTASF